MIPCLKTIDFPILEEIGIDYLLYKMKFLKFSIIQKTIQSSQQRLKQFKRIFEFVL